MLFTSINFIFFLIIVFLIYYVIPKKIRWIWLLVASYFFYGCASYIYILFLFTSTLLTYGCSLFIEKIRKAQEVYANDDTLSSDDKKKLKTKNQKKCKIILLLAIILLIGLLIMLKYLPFIFSIIKVNFSPLSLLLPVGLSFYIFQSVGYCIDVYRESYAAQRNFFKYALFISFFPQILQGPIGNYNSLSSQLYNGNSFDYIKFTSGLQRILWGFFKKLVVADRLALMVNTVYGNYNNYSGFVLLFATIFFAFQLYADFSGYMDIALGCAEALGIKLDENFSQPYFAKTIAEFWRRWHITLGSWFRNYVYYPILRSKCCLKIPKIFTNKKTSKNLTISLALLVTWILIGLWHGAAWKYVIYGLYYGIIIITSIILMPFYEKMKKKMHINAEKNAYKIFQIFRTFVLVCFGYIIFRADTIEQAFHIVGRMIFSFFNGITLSVKNLLVSLFVGNFSAFDFLLSVFSIAIIIVVDIIQNKTDTRKLIAKQNIIIRWAIFYLLLLMILLFGCYGSSSTNSFIYFEF